ncbi:MAG: SMC family ATPase [Chloroflexota bacterium]
MLPVSLSLRNFLSYRDAAPTLLLDHVHVACLTGANGNGKSALLDAITWALWGRARSQRQEQLLHHGQEEMSVELVFDARGERYRAQRRYSRARRTPASSLELAVETGPDNWRPITGDAISATQEQLDRILGMDYETFINSAFLVQGRADAFTMATPAARKEVLSRVLDLGLYQRLEERAKTHARSAQARLEAVAGTMERLRERAGAAGPIAEELAALEVRLATAQAEAQAATVTAAALTAQVQGLSARRGEAERIQAQAERLAVRRAEDETAAAGLRTRIERWNGVRERAEEIGRGMALLADARAALQAVGAAAAQSLALERELGPLERAVASQRGALEREGEAQRHRIERELEPRASALPALQGRLRELTAALEALGVREQEAEALAAEVQRASAEAARIGAGLEALTLEGQRTREKVALLEGAPEGAACPLCGSALGPEQHQHMASGYQAELAAQRERYRTLDAEAKWLQAHAADAQHRAETARRAVADERRALEAQRARAEGERERAQEAAASLEEARRVLTETEDAIRTRSYAVSERERIAELRAQLEAVTYDPMAARAAEGRVAALEPWEHDSRLLADALERAPDDEASLARLLARMEADSAEAAGLDIQRAAIAVELGGLPALEASLREAQEGAAQAGAQRDALRTQAGALAQRLEEARAAGEELAAQEAAHRAVTREASAYSELATAFGRGGVQALLIEAALPRLEDEANSLLHRMTDGRMSLRLETQRVRKGGRAAGEMAETLELVIADELGTRSYEMFSGGERFRVDLALRIALSQLLAWRAGAALPTLFIDEGFGTQDAQGRERILEVVQAIEDRFQRILVITHMDELKEAFPVRIEVSRTPNGSTFSLS